MTMFLKSLMGKKVKTTPVADAAIAATQLLLDERVRRMLEHHNQNERQLAKSDLPPLAG